MDKTAIHLFVYGTLKKGHIAHNRFCSRAAIILSAIVRGRLYLLPEGYPALDVPEEDILAMGSGNIERDAVVEKQMAGFLSGKTLPPGREAGWRNIPGEILRFDNPGETLPAIDAYEDFFPSGKSLYQRVLVPVETPDGRKPAWTYVVAGDSKKDQLRRARNISHWPLRE